MTEALAGIYRVRYGVTLPVVCDPNSGEAFFLTVDGVAEGRGLYVCTALNTWKRLGLAGQGPVLPGTCNPGDVWVIDVGVNIGIYICQIVNVWSKIEGDYTGANYNITINPTIFTDFADARFWVPVNDFTNFTQAFDANGLMTITAIGVQDLVNTYRSWSGVMCRLHLFPSLITGRIVIITDVDSLVPPTVVGGNTWINYGMIYGIMGYAAEGAGYGYQGNDQIADFWVHQATDKRIQPWNMAQVAFFVGGTAARVRIIIDWLAAQRAYYVTSVDYDIGAGWVNLPGVAFIHGFNPSFGLQFGVGAAQRYKMGDGSARFTQFELNEGRMIAGPHI